jgi:DNA repair exonuclease SbcCD ATPase subunit
LLRAQLSQSGDVALHEAQRRARDLELRLHAVSAAHSSSQLQLSEADTADDVLHGGTGAAHAAGASDSRLAALHERVSTLGAALSAASAERDALASGMNAAGEEADEARGLAQELGMELTEARAALAAQSQELAEAKAALLRALAAPVPARAGAASAGATPGGARHASGEDGGSLAASVERSERLVSALQQQVAALEGTPGQGQGGLPSVLLAQELDATRQKLEKLQARWVSARSAPPSCTHASMHGSGR